MKELTTLCAWSLTIGALAWQGALAEGAGFDPVINHRITQTIELPDTAPGGPAAGVAFYSDYEDHRTTFNNRSVHGLRFHANQGYIARIPPGELFSVPCDGITISGWLEVLVGSNRLEVHESPLCGDLVVLHRKEGES